MLLLKFGCLSANFVVFWQLLFYSSQDCSPPILGLLGKKKKKLLVLKPCRHSKRIFWIFLTILVWSFLVCILYPTFTFNSVMHWCKTKLHIFFLELLTLKPFWYLLHLHVHIARSWPLSRLRKFPLKSVAMLQRVILKIFIMNIVSQIPVY